MIRYFLARPIAVLTIFFCVAIAGFLGYTKLPVSLMPDISTPRLVIVVNYPGFGAEYIEQNVLAGLRNQLSGLYGLEQVESISANNVGHLDLTFEYNADMKLAFIEANEKLDQASRFLPENLPRPQVYRISDTDIPVLRLQIQSNELGAPELSNLTRFVLRRRIEGISGVAKVVVNGLTDQVIKIQPKMEILQSLQISEAFLVEALRQANFDQFQLRVKEGIYEYNVRVENPLKSIEAIRNLVFTLPKGGQVAVGQVAEVAYGTQEPVGAHLYQGAEGIVINIHKQASANIRDLEAELMTNIDQLTEEFPKVRFEITQNQSSLLALSISQLSNSLILGGLLAFAILFVFSANYKLSILMGLIIPATILVTFGIFYLSGLSINIITLSGLILGIGMLIDNAIILIDNIHLHHQNGMPLLEACAKGANEIFTPLLSSAFTTLSVFLPLIFLGGIGGSFFQFQAMSLAAMLLGSLLVAFCLLPVIYRLLRPNPANDSSRLYSRLLGAYKSSKKRGGFVNAALIGSFVVAIWCVSQISVTNLPELRTEDASIKITWAEPITLNENIERTLMLIQEADSTLKQSEFEVGIHSLNPSQPSFTNSLTGYFKFDGVASKESNLKRFENLIRREYGAAKWEFGRAKNPFDQLFDRNSSFIKVKFRPSGQSMLKLDQLELPQKNYAQPEYGFITQKGLYLDVNEDRLNQINVTTEELIDQIKYYYQDQLVTEIQRTNQKERVQLEALGSSDKPFLNAVVFAKDSLSAAYPVGYFFDWKEQQVHQFVTADLAGIYQSVDYSEAVDDPAGVVSSIEGHARNDRFIVDMEGSYLLADQNISDLIISLLLAVTLLFFILAAQFESLKQPLIILITLPIALAGSVLGLYFTSYSINISSMIGMIVTLGIIVNDSILKIDTINRMRKEGQSTQSAVVKAGELRLKPILMTSITTILALLPLLFSSGLGADLQAPLAVTVIGGLLVGTLCSVYMIPILYRRLIK